MAADRQKSRLIVACPHCKARFDVSAFRPGSKIRCGSCYKILRIPDRTRDSIFPTRSDNLAGAAAAAASAEAPAPPKPSSKASPPKPAGGQAVKPPPEPKVASTPAGEDPLIGTRLNNEFELVRLLGQGGYGSVYEALDVTLKRRVAVKLMLREKTTKKEFVDKFLREARTAAQLSHPNIVKIHHVGFSKDLQQHFLAMEYVEGKTLSQIMGEQGAFPIDLAVDVIVQSANGLAEAHRKNIIHRDIKPGNIMITPKGVVKIADFGLAKIYDPDDKASTVIGTPYFMPPEQFEGKAKDGRTDIYSLGVTFYYIVTLKRPFDGRTPAEVLLNVMRTDPVPPREHNREIPEALSKIILRMISRSLEERYSTCDEILRELKSFHKKEEAEGKIYCPACGFGNRLGKEACEECGGSLLEPCPSCGTPDFIGAKFCGNCGANLDRERQVAEILAEAQAHVVSGRFDEALAKYEKARNLAPEHTRVIEGIRAARAAQTEREQAVASIEKLLSDGDYVGALPLAEEAAEKFPNYEPISQLIARARDAAKDTRLSSALEEARILLQAGDLQDALNAARLALSIDSSNEEARKVLGKVEKNLDEHEAARGRARRLEEERRLPDALESWRKALAVMPSDEVAQQAISRIEGVLGQVEKLRARAEEALSEKDLARARSALEDAVGVLPAAPDTCALFDRLRTEEQLIEKALVEALGRISRGDFGAAADSLEEMAQQYPREKRLRETAQRAMHLQEIAASFVAETEKLLSDGSPALAAEFARAAVRVDPAAGGAERLVERAEEAAAQREKGLSLAREHLQSGSFDEALEALEAQGGMTSRSREVAELTRKALEGRQSQERGERDQKKQVLEAALQTARDLLKAGRAQAALAACQKALRIDRNHPEARSLKGEVDALLEKAGKGHADSRVETAFFELDDFGKDG